MSFFSLAQVGGRAGMAGQRHTVSACRIWLSKQRYLSSHFGDARFKICVLVPLHHPPWQALRLFVHYPFLVRASAHCRRTGVQAEGNAAGDCLEGEAVRWAVRQGDAGWCRSRGIWFVRQQLCSTVHGTSWCATGATLRCPLPSLQDVPARADLLLAGPALPVRIHSAGKEW